jgi:hypothetical protein
MDIPGRINSYKRFTVFIVAKRKGGMLKID